MQQFDVGHRQMADTADLISALVDAVMFADMDPHPPKFALVDEEITPISKILLNGARFGLRGTRYSDFPQSRYLLNQRDAHVRDE